MAGIWKQEIKISGPGSKVSKHHEPERHQGGQGGNDQSWHGSGRHRQDVQQMRWMVQTLVHPSHNWSQ